MIIEFEEKILDKIDARIETASDDELFAGGYLRGHIALSVSRCEELGISDIEVLASYINDSLEKAKSELSPADRIIVATLWHDLQA